MRPSPETPCVSTWQLRSQKVFKRDRATRDATESTLASRKATIRSPSRASYHSHRPSAHCLSTTVFPLSTTQPEAKVWIPARNRCKP